MAGTRVPFPYITGLPEQARREIERDFLHLQMQITSAASVFDAIIDPAFTADDAANHKYRNLTALALNEVWLTELNVGVIGRTGLTIIETAPDISGRGDITFTAAGASGGSGFNAPDWDWKTVTTHAAQKISFTGILINPTTAGQNIGTTADTITSYVGCRVTGNMNNASGGTLFAYDTQFDCSSMCSQSGRTANLYSCVLAAGVNVSGNNGLIMVGGEIRGTSTIGGTGNFIIAAAISAAFNIATTGAADTIVHNIGVTGGNLSVSGTSNAVMVEGSWANVTFSGVSAFARVFKGYVEGALDVTGPIHVVASVRKLFGGTTLATLRGSNIQADLQVKGDGTPVKLIGAIDSQVKVDWVSGAGAGCKAYDIDSASLRCIVIASGTRHPDFTVPSVNLGVQCLVMTELGIVAPPGTPSPGYIGGTTQGPPGMDGDDGPEGPPGPPGVAGAAGAPGVSGASTTTQGPMGFDGSDGDDGFPGMPGNTGATGATGPAGPMGLHGFGTDGEDGVEGFPGPPGNTGPPGATGTAGAAGAAGQAGPPGPDGDQGDDGYMFGATDQSAPFAIIEKVAGGNKTINKLTSIVQYTSITTGANANIATLPAAAAVPNGWLVTLVDTSGTAVGATAGAGTEKEIQFKAGAGDTMEGVAVATNFEVVRDPFGLITVMSDGVSNWSITALFPTVRSTLYSASSAAGWRRPLKAVTALARLRGGGGAGGGGQKVPLAIAGSGGGPGSPGSYTEQLFHTSDAAVTESVVVGTGGAPGAAVTASGSGNVGGNGLKSTFTLNAVVQYTADGGLGGAGGAAGTGGVGGTPGVLAQRVPVNGAVGSNGTVAATAATKSTDHDLPGSPGGGGGTTAANALLAASAGGASCQGFGSAGTGRAGAAAGGAGLPGGNSAPEGVAGTANTGTAPGPGGGGGNTVAGNGGNGGTSTGKGQGGGGGGVGIGVSGTNQNGLGGAGTDGFVEIIEYR